MSIENVKAFYARLASDEAFRTQLQAVISKQECSQIVKNAGYNFTTDEFEEYTVHLLESSSDNDEIKDLDEKELEAVFGGASKIIYGHVDIDKILLPIDEKSWSWYAQPSYGAPIDDDLLDALVVDHNLLNEISVNDNLSEH